MERIIIKNAYENNLKHINLEIPLNAFNCVTGCSGSGKSSLVFDTVYAESQRAFLEGMSGNIYGQKLMNKPKVTSVENLRPALNISQNYYNVNPRSTIGTATEISYFLRSLFSIVNSNEKQKISENMFSYNNPKSFCKNCMGLGVETVISESLLIPDREKTLKEGAILYFKGSTESKEQKYLQALCEYYKIDINKKFSELTEKEISDLLYSNEKIKYKISYKEGKRRKQHYVFLQGAVSEIKEKINQTEHLSSSLIYSKYMEDIPCHVCNGTKFSKDILGYKLNGKNYSEIEEMELTELYCWFNNFDINTISVSRQNVVLQIINSIKNKLKSLIYLKLGYLCLNRSIPSLSGGERQRVRLAAQLTCSLKDLIYILDEPCKGLHCKDITNIIEATKNLVEQGNTVIAIEHNRQYISAADNIFELGPVGGPQGGYIVSTNHRPVECSTCLSLKKHRNFSDFFEIKNINFRNIKEQNIKVPLGGITCITGVSGSGKSSLAAVIANCFEHKNAWHCEFFSGIGSIKKTVEVNQAPIGKTQRSTVVSYLEIYDEIRNIFAETETAKILKIPSSFFSMNVKGGRCECCQGTGFQKLELNYLPDSYIECPECEGRRFNDKILSVRYKDKTIQEILDTPVSDIINIFEDNKKINSVLKSMNLLGLGYLKLGQMSMNLSGGEAQRIKLARALGVLSGGHNLYILDEPTSGLNDIDIKRFETILESLQRNHETVIIIEHNIEFIADIADYIIDFGMSGGNAGGKISVQGEPEDVFYNKESSLYGINI